MPEVQLCNADRSSAMLGQVRVLRISHSGSVAAYRERERRLLQPNSNIDLKLIVPENWKHLGGSSITAESFEVIPTRTYGTGSIPLFAYAPTALAKVIKQFQPDIIDIHEEPYSVSCFEIISLAKLLRPSAACVFYSAQNILKKYPPPFSLSEQYVYRVSVGAYPCSSEVREVLRAKGFSTNCRLIPLGTDTNVFRPTSVDRTKFGLKENAFVIGYFGRLEECKGLEYLFKALSQLSLEIDWQLFIIGKGSFENSLRSLAMELSISSRIIWGGEVSAARMPERISSCDVTVVPSLTTASWKEQFGRSVVESMACGVPVIASDSGSLPEVTGGAGLLVPERSSSALAHVLARIAQNPDERRELSKKGQALVEAQYTWKKVAESTLDFYGEALRIQKQRQK